MKRIIFFVSVIAMLLCSVCVNASDYTYKLTEMKVTSDNVTVRAKKINDYDSESILFIALYDDGILSSLKWYELDMENGQSDTFTAEIYDINSISSIKAYVWNKPLIPGSTVLSRSTTGVWNIEFGGDL